jgi:hypothetical protein
MLSMADRAVEIASAATARPDLLAAPVVGV